MRKKRIMIIGPRKSGKSTLAHKINDEKGTINKSQDVIYGKETIEVPGAYLESSWMYKHIIALSQDASHILFLIDESQDKRSYSPGFAKAFSCPVYGVIIKGPETKSKREESIKIFKEAGVTAPYFILSLNDSKGILEVKEKLKNKGNEK